MTNFGPKTDKKRSKMSKSILFTLLSCFLLSCPISWSQMNFEVVASSEPVDIEKLDLGYFITEGEYTYFAIDDGRFFSLDDDLQQVAELKIPNDPYVSMERVVTEDYIILFMLKHEPTKNLFHFEYSIYDHGTLEPLDEHVELETFEYKGADYTATYSRAPKLFWEETQNGSMLYAKVYEPGNYVTTDPRFLVLELNEELAVTKTEGPILEGFEAPEGKEVKLVVDKGRYYFIRTDLTGENEAVDIEFTPPPSMNKEDIRYHTVSIEEDIYGIVMEFEGESKKDYGGLFVKLVDFSAETVKSWTVNYPFTKEDKKLVKKMFSTSFRSLDLWADLNREKNRFSLSCQVILIESGSYVGTRWYNNTVVLDLELDSEDYSMSLIPSDVVRINTVVAYAGYLGFRNDQGFFQLRNRERGKEMSRSHLGGPLEPVVIQVSENGTVSGAKVAFDLAENEKMMVATAEDFPEENYFLSAVRVQNKKSYQLKVVKVAY